MTTGTSVVGTAVAVPTEPELLTFDKFMEPDQIEYEVVQVPNKGPFRIASISSEDFTEWSIMRGTTDGRKISAAWLIAKSMVDKDGNRIGNPARAGEIQKKNLRTTETVLAAIFHLNGISSMKAEAIAKNG